jgi:hypothetical protein
MDARDLFFAAMGKEIDTIIDKEGKLLADATHAIFNMLVDGDSTTVSDPTTWTFQGTRQYILLKEFGQKLKAELEPKLPDLLRRFGPMEETLVPRQDSRTRCFSKDWQPGGRYTVAFVPIHRATAQALTASS